MNTPYTATSLYRYKNNNKKKTNNKKNNNNNNNVPEGHNRPCLLVGHHGEFR